MARDLLPTTNLHVMHVRNKLGYPSMNVATLCGEKSACAAYINRWSRRKPVRYASSTVDRSSEWWRASDGLCGLAVNSYTSVGGFDTSGTFLYRLIRQLDQWDYVPPTGGSTSPYRLGDFAGYYHDAICPVGVPESAAYYISTSGTISVGFDLAVSDGDEDNLTLADIEVGGVSLSRFYVGLLMRKSSGSYFIGTSSARMGTGSVSCEISPLTSSHVGVWTGYPFLAADSFSCEDSVPSTTFVPLPVTPLVMNVKSSSTIIQVYCVGVWASTAKTAIEFNFYFENENSGSITASNTRAIVVRVSGSGDPETDGETVATYTYGSVTVPGGSTLTVPSGSTLTISVTYESGYSYWMAGLTGNSSIQTTYYPVEELPV